MKLTKFLVTTVVVTLLAAFTAAAQSPGVLYVYTTAGGQVNGGTNNVAVSSTNTYAAFNVSEFDNLGLEYTIKGTGAGTSTVQIFGYKSLDSTTYETTPSFKDLVTLNGTTAVSTITNISIPTAGTFKLQIGNTNASVGVTNVVLQRRLKAPKQKDI